MSKPFIERSSKAISTGDMTDAQYEMMFDDEFNEQMDRQSRLQQLREDFYTARSVVDKMVRTDLIFSRRVKKHRYEWMEDLERCASAFRGQTPEWHDGDDSLLKKTLEAARRYIIARDFQEFDPGKALMLWKLQNGGAL